MGILFIVSYPIVDNERNNDISIIVKTELQHSQIRYGYFHRVVAIGLCSYYSLDLFVCLVNL